MTCYPERRNGRLTGVWIAEALFQGERRRKRFPTKLEGERWADFTTATGTLPDTAPAVVTHGPSFGEVASECKAAHPAWKSGRDKSAIPRLEYVVDVIGKDTPIAEVSTLMLDKIVKGLAKRPGRTKVGKVSPGTINRYLTAASTVLTFAVARGYLPASPTVPWQTERSQQFYWLTEAQEDAICAWLTQKGQTTAALTVRVLTATGIRWSEFASLEPAQIDGEWIRLWQTKTDRPRSVPIPVELATALKAVTVLPEYHTFRKWLKKALKVAGCDDTLAVHALRHTTATRLVQRGVHIAVVQRWLGHSSIQTTMRYAHVADEDLSQAAAKLSQHAGQTTASAAVIGPETLIT